MISATTGACALVLLASGLGHLARTAETAHETAAHGVLPARWTRGLAVLLPVLELALGGLLLVGLLAPTTPLARGASLAAAALFAGFAGYLLLVLRRGAGGLPCACGVGGAPLGGWSVVRAGGLAVLALVGVAATTPVTDRPWEQVAVIGCAALSLAIGVSALPAARHHPRRDLRGIPA